MTMHTRYGPLAHALLSALAGDQQKGEHALETRAAVLVMSDAQRLESALVAALEASGWVRKSEPNLNLPQEGPIE